MQRSESVKEFAAAFLKAQQAMKPAAKDSVNPHFKSRYADLAAVVEAVRGPLNDNGISFLQAVRLGERGVEVETYLLHTSGEWMSDTLTVPIPRNDAQSVGSATSYGKRYGLQSMCGIPSEDDDGNAATKGPPKKLASEDRRYRDIQAPQNIEKLEDGTIVNAGTGETIPPPRASGRQVQQLRDLLEKAKAAGIANGDTAAKWYAKFGVERFEDLTSVQIMQLITKVRSMLDTATTNAA